MIESELAANAGRGEHTPTPWRVIKTKFFNQPDSKNYVSIVSADFSIAKLTGSEGMDPEEVTDAAFIVKAVNSHAELVAALQACVRQLTELGYDGSSSGADAALEKAR